MRVFISFSMATISKPLILIVEDDEPLAEITSEHLELAGMHTQIFPRADKAITFLKKNHVNLVLLDITLPGTDGFAVFEEIKKLSEPPPVIFFTGNTAEASKIRGLETGADYYVTKPFSIGELIARIKAVIRRTDTRHDLNVTPNTTVTDEPFYIDKVKIDCQRLEMTFPDGLVDVAGKKEIGILRHFHEHPNVVIPRKNLIHAVWGPHADPKSRSLDQYIVRIRDQFREHGADAACLRTVHGIGFIYEPHAHS